jgi:hypothetical protein
MKRPVGRALIVGGASSRGQPLAGMQALGYACAELEDPYAAAAEIFKRPLVYRALVLSLTSVYREELALLATLKARLPHIEVWLTHTEGRQAAMVEAIRLGAAGLLGDDGVLHRIPSTASPAEAPHEPAEDPAPASPADALASDVDSDYPTGEPVLSADELRALLQEQPTMPPDIDA